LSEARPGLGGRRTSSAIKLSNRPLASCGTPIIQTLPGSVEAKPDYITPRDTIKKEAKAVVDRIDSDAARIARVVAFMMISVGFSHQVR
jgi:hypothetical protein